jgi:hypothetical protein
MDKLMPPLRFFFVIRCDGVMDIYPIAASDKAECPGQSRNIFS